MNFLWAKHFLYILLWANAFFPSFNSVKYLKSVEMLFGSFLIILKNVLLSLISITSSITSNSNYF